jgi:hypothetical protein
VKSRDLAGALHAARTNAAGADTGCLVGAALVDADGLQVGQPAAAGFVHCVADIIAGHRTFAAHVAALCHFRRDPLESCTEFARNLEHYSMRGSLRASAVHRSSTCRHRTALTLHTFHA